MAPNWAFFRTVPSNVNFTECWKKSFSHFPVAPVWLLTPFYSQKCNYMLSYININTFLTQVICCPMSLFAFTVYHSGFQPPKNCFLSSELELGHAFSTVAVAAAFTTKRVGGGGGGSSLAVLEEHITVPHLQTNLTYPPVSFAEHSICPLLVNRLQDAVFYPLLIFFHYVCLYN